MPIGPQTAQPHRPQATLQGTPAFHLRDRIPAGGRHNEILQHRSVAEYREEVQPRRPSTIG